MEEKPPFDEPPEVIDRFLPVDLERVLEDLSEHARREGSPVEDLEAVFRVVTQMFQLLMGAQLGRLRRRYHAYDPDRETIPAHDTPPRGSDCLRALCGDLKEMLERANFRRVPTAEVEAAMQKVSPRGLRVHVDLELFDLLEFYVRGTAVRQDPRRVVRGGRVKTVMVETPIHRRLCVFAKLRGKEESEEELRIATEEEQPRRDRLYVKLFRDVAHSDLEMLLPNTKVRMTLFDKVKLSVTGGGGTIGGLVATGTKIGAAAHPVTWAFALVGFGGVVWRQFAKLIHTRVRYMASLARKLYTRNLDNNFGAITRVVELAEEEEIKEALLAWYFLQRRGERGATLEELDEEVEAHLERLYAIGADFEVHDGVAKLERRGLCETGADGRLRAPDPAEARRRLEAAWLDLLRPAPAPAP